MPETKTNTKPRLSQRFYAASAMAFTFCWGLSACSVSPPAVPDATPVAASPVADFTPIEPLSGLWEPLEPPTFAPPELLQRLRAGFDLDKVENRRIDAERDWFVRHPDYLDRVFTRAQRYLPHITAGP